nr:MAG TPA: hypothetical protein [Caudoviricetes sp.]
MHQKNGRYYLRGWGMRGEKQPGPCPPKNRNTCLISLRLAGKVIYRR